MNPTDWGQIKNFKPDEAWGDPKMMDFHLVFLLDAFRTYIQTPIHILCGTQGKHVDGSFHYQGKAVDVYVDGFPGGAWDLLLTVTRFPFGGIGFYPDWEYMGKKGGGLHLDSRPTPLFAAHHWMGVKHGPHQDYIDLTEENLKIYLASDS